MVEDNRHGGSVGGGDRISMSFVNTRKNNFKESKPKNK
jgi:hypothetical protein